MTLEDVKKKPVYFVEVYVSRYNKQHELDVPLNTGYHVFNNYDLQYLPIEIDTSKPIKGFYYDNVEDNAFKSFIDELYQKKLDGSKEAKGVMNKMIGMLGRTRKTFMRDVEMSRASGFIVDHPLLKYITMENEHSESRTTSENEQTQKRTYLHPLDYVYNYIHVYSLVLSKAKQIMEDLFRECHNKGIRMFCTSTDSVYILTKDLPKLEHHIGKDIGKLKIEAEGDKACFAGYRLYAIGDSKVILPNRSGKGLTFNDFVKKYYKGGCHI